MANPAEIPQLTTELYEMSKAYLEQETVEPLKRPGKYAGFSLGAGILFAIGWLLLSIAGVRLTQDLLPDTELYSVLAYVITAVVGIAVAAGLMGLASRVKGL